MKSLTRILPLAVLAAVPAVALAASPKVWLTNCHKVAYKPRSLSLSCGDANNTLRQLTWSSWTSTKATGKGINDVNPCTPNCASSRTKPYPATVTLSHPKLCKNVGLKVFNRITLTYTDKRPGPEKTVTETLGCPLTG
jgi:hypothetical protein